MKASMCEYREIDPTERIIYKISPLDSSNLSVLASLKTRSSALTRLTSRLNKVQFQDMIRTLKLNKDETEKLWLLLAYCNYHLISPLAFFDFLLEVAIEERITLKSYTSAEALRSWQNHPIPATFQDNFLVFLYLAIRDGARAYSLLETIDAL